MKYEKVISEARDWKLTFEVDIKEFYTYLEEEMNTTLQILGANDKEIKFHQKMLDKMIETSICEFIECKLFGAKNKAASHIASDEPWDYVHDKLLELRAEYPLWFVLDDSVEMCCECCGTSFDDDNEVETPELYGRTFTVCNRCLKFYFDDAPPAI